ncbi:MAG: DUF86 domain-containing protein [Candidatus Parvarchaeota archaeon]|nr:DUF86 domain-containing protein [Candidatus Parvarchaeum tengchongense]MCW1295274.1 DUF86 domain-containing protein [Candidatus Parvarchaeum tengchongense]MCW1299431.1 DUF86 domain-containing protein [Candidatus Parvarchaeum tengchongense]MCW1311923.1 DUF86 domain-containing protein [Candidatus Parvarchaeum tengchongense]
MSKPRKEEKDDIEYIKHIINAIQLIKQYTKDLQKDEFTKNNEKQDAVIRELAVIGEASKNISDSFKVKNNFIEWKKLAGVRDIVVHQYFNIDLDIIWDIIKYDLPELKKKLETIKN